MANPRNNLNLQGTVASDPFYSSKRDGTEFACSFILAVKRNYANKGEYLSDMIVCKVENEERMKACHDYIKKGAKISILGCLKTDKKPDGSYVMYVLTESFVADRGDTSSFVMDIDVNNIPFH